MAVGKCDPNADVIDGLIFVSPTLSHEREGAVHFSQATGIATLDNISSRHVAGGWQNDCFPLGTGDVGNGVNAIAQVGYAAPGYGRRHAFYGIAGSLSQTPSGAGVSLKIESPSGTVIFGPLALTQAGAFNYQFNEGLRGGVNKEMFASLTPGGLSVSGNLTVTMRRVE